MILVTGATGNVGRELLARLAAAGEGVRAMSRDPSTAAVPDGVEVVAGDLSAPASLASALAGVDRVFLMIPPSFGPAHAPVQAFADAASTAGVEHVVFLSSQTAEEGVTGAIADAHRACEAVLRASPLRWTFLEPSNFMSNARYWIPEIARTGRVLDTQRNIPLAPIDPYDIAEVAALALADADNHAERVYPITGPELISPEQQVQVLRELTGRDIVYKELTWEEAVAQVALLSGDPEHAEGILETIRGVDPPWSRVSPTFEQVTGHPGRTFRRYVEAHIDEFSA